MTSSDQLTDNSLSLNQQISLVQQSVIKFAESFLTLTESDPFEASLMTAMRYAMLNGGKHIRPFLLMQSASLFNVDHSSALRAACAVELVHTFSLVHDDLPAMDNAHLRRGKPSLHVQFDEAMAILAGDALLTSAFQVLSEDETHPDPKIRLELVKCLAKTTGARGMCAGQVMDLMTENQVLDTTSIVRLQRRKTGYLLEASCSMGAILGRASTSARQALHGFAHDLGLAYQITDDILDAEGNTDEIGKPVGTDSVLGKSNLVTLMGIKEAREHAAILVSQAISHLDYFDEKAKYLRELANQVLSRRA